MFRPQSMNFLRLFMITVITLAGRISASCPNQCSCVESDSLIVVVDCAWKNLTQVPTFDGEDLLNVTELHLQHNEIAQLPADAFQNLPALRHLYLQGNQLSELEVGLFANLNLLTSLYLNDNSIATLKDDQFIDLISLKIVYLQNNKIASLKNRSFAGLDQVIELSLAGNTELESIEPDVFCSSMTLLKRLDLSGNSIPTLYPTPFQCLNLDELYINNPQHLDCDASLKSFKQWADGTGSSLKNQRLMRCTSPDHMIGLSLGQISSVNLVSDDSCPSQCSCFSNVVDCSDINLSQVPDDIPSSAIELHLQNNLLAQLSANQFVHLPSLKFLNLQYNVISSTNLASFNNLPALQVLNLNDNLIDAVLPEAFQDLANLVVLNLQNNDIKTLDDEVFRNLTSIEQLSLAGNSNLKQIGLRAFCDLTTLARLDLSDILLPNWDAEMFSCIPNLQDLYINNPKVLKCDETLKEFKQWADGPSSTLRTQSTMRCTAPVHMSALQLSSLTTTNLVAAQGSCPLNCSCFAAVVDCSWQNYEAVPDDIPSTTNELFLQYNKLTDLEQNQFVHLPQLKHLHLSYNEIASVNRNAFAGLSSLLQLHMNDNLVSTLATSLSQFEQVKVLNLQNNKISALNDRSFQSLPKLEQLAVSGNSELTTISNETFCQLSSLTNLDISGSSIEVFRPDSFTCLSALDNLYLNDLKALRCDGELRDFKRWADGDASVLRHQNLITCTTPDNMDGVRLGQITTTNLVSMGTCPAQCSCFSQIVDCADRDLNEVPDMISPDTKELHLQQNSLTQLSANQFVHLSDLEYLYLQENSIAAVASSSFSSSAALQSLNLGRNSIARLDAGTFASLTQLTALNLNDNQISSLDGAIFSDLVRLRELGIHGNRLDRLAAETFQQLREMRYLGVANNSLTSVPDYLGDGFADAYLIDYSDNKLTDVPRPPPNLRQLYVERNSDITTIKTGTFDRASSLYELFASDCGISQVESGSWGPQAGNLAWLMLQNNQFKSVNGATFSGLVSLQAVFLTGNKNLASIAPDTLNTAGATLQRLLVDGCKLERLDAAFLEQFTNDDFYVWLGDNPWLCDCDSQDLSEFISANEDRVADSSKVTCADDASQLVGEVDYQSCTSPGVQTTAPSKTTTTRKSTTTQKTTAAQKTTTTVKTTTTTTTTKIGTDSGTSDNSALVISLSIVGAVVVFLAMGACVYKKGASRASFESMRLSDDDEGMTSMGYVNYSEKLDDFSKSTPI